MISSNNRIWVLGSVLVGGALLAGGWFVGVQPLLSAASDNGSSETQADQQNQTLETRLLSLQEAQRNIGTLRVEAAKAASAVPATLDAQSFVSRINLLAADDNVQVTSITPGTAIGYTEPDSSQSKVEAYVSPQITASNLAALPISVQVVGTGKQVRVFLGDVQHDSRLFLVDGVTIGASPLASGGTAGTFSGYIYALKGTDGAS